MSAPTKLIAFLVGLVAVFLAATGAGAVVAPVLDGATTDGTHEPTHETDPAEQPQVDSLPGGLMISQNGYTLALAKDQLAAGPARDLEFTVIGPTGEPVTDYKRSHEKDLHLIAVRRDLSGFQHVHPTLDAEGTWSVPLSLTSGQWRVFADFEPAGHGDNLVLGADLAVTGEYAPRPLPASTQTAEVDGYTVRLDGDLVPGEESELTLSVTRNGTPVTDLQPYLGAYGHLVALRDGDLAYLHVHPAGMPGDGTTRSGPEVTFYAMAPSRGSYRLFLDFRHDGAVRTAEFTVHAGDSVREPTEETGGTDHSDHSGDEGEEQGHGH